LMAGSKSTVDPSIVATNVSPDATAYTFQRKVFYEPSGGRYWAFYRPCSSCVMKSTSSADGLTWASPSDLPVLLDSRQDVNLLYAYNIGRSVVITQGQSVTGSGGQSLTVWLNYTIGTISGSAISWGPLTAVTSESAVCASGYTLLYPWHPLLQRYRHNWPGWNGLLGDLVQQVLPRRIPYFSTL
jgi:hypothetical protein